MIPLWPVAALLGVLGLAVGSFLNVVIYRVPREQSIMFPASRCPRCEMKLKRRHNVPIVSWLALRGKCSSCSEPISVRYPLVEAATAGLFVAVTLRFGLTMALPAYLYLVAISITLAMIAADNMRLPDSLVLPSYVMAVLLLMPAGADLGEWYPALRAVAGLVTLSGIYFALTLAYPSILNLADVKLASLLGLYLGWMSWSALLVGALGGLMIGALGGGLRIAAQHSGRGARVTLGPWMIVGTGLALFVTVPVTAWYASVLAVT